MVPSLSFNAECVGSSVNILFDKQDADILQEIINKAFHFKIIFVAISSIYMLSYIDSDFKDLML